ncbi:MAG: hypothetical protein ACTSUE_12610 [Promethearchaeota archaeon]
MEGDTAATTRRSVNYAIVEDSPGRLVIVAKPSGFPSWLKMFLMSVILVGTLMFLILILGKRDDDAELISFASILLVWTIIGSTFYAFITITRNFFIVHTFVVDRDSKQFLHQRLLYNKVTRQHLYRISAIESIEVQVQYTPIGTRRYKRGSMKARYAIVLRLLPSGQKILYMMEKRTEGMNAFASLLNEGLKHESRTRSTTSDGNSYSMAWGD